MIPLLFCVDTSRRRRRRRRRRRSSTRRARPREGHADRGVFESHRDVADGVRAARRRRVHDEGIGRALVRARISETAGSTIATNAHIYGPFEAGFSAQQDNIISNWGCSPASLAYDTAGGLDLGRRRPRWRRRRGRASENLWRGIRRHRRFVRWTHRRLSLSRWVRVL